jgi:hypothetical protein
LNTVGIEGGQVHDVLTSEGFEKEVDRNNYWQGFINKRWMKAPVYERLAEVVDSPEIRKDFRNVAALANIVQAKKDPQAVVYMHQIIHDLDKWVYENMHKGEEVSHFYVTNAEVGDKIYKIEEYIKRNVVD